MPAFDVAAEMALLGAVMMKADEVGPVLLSVPIQAWWVPKHRTVAGIVGDMLNRGQAVDATTVMSQLQAEGRLTSELGAYLFTLYQAPYVPAHAPSYAERLRSLWAHREIQAAAAKLAQRLDSGWQDGDEAEWDTALAEFRTTAEAAELAASTTAAEPPMSIAELLEGQDRHDWLIPGLLERRERFILTGAEGIGKSVLASQIAACLAGGLHPFTGNPLGSRGWSLRVLIADAENNEAQTRRRYRRIVRVVDEIREMHGLPQVDWRDVMRVALRPEGVDLLSNQDVAWLEHAVQATSPDLLVVGPLYRLHHVSENDAEAARRLQHVIDGIRARHGCAVLTEAHAGHATHQATGDRLMRPAGTSAWLRWPEFGYGLRRSKHDDGGEHPNIVDVVAWRGSREERAWPQQLFRGHDGLLPWRPSADYYQNLEAA